jgi:hypothetical protein
MTISTTAVSASITAENTFSTDTLAMIRAGGTPFSFSLSGTWIATVWLQRSFDGGVTWLDVESYTANIEDTGFEPVGGAQYRFGVKTGGYTSGTVVGRLAE